MSNPTVRIIASSADGRLKGSLSIGSIEWMLLAMPSRLAINIAANARPLPLRLLAVAFEPLDDDRHLGSVKDVRFA